MLIGAILQRVVRLHRRRTTKMGQRNIQQLCNQILVKLRNNATELFNKFRWTICLEHRSERNSKNCPNDFIPRMFPRYCEQPPGRNRLPESRPSSRFLCNTISRRERHVSDIYVFSRELFCRDNVGLQVAWGTAVMELQSWLLYHLVAVTDCNQVMQSATTLNGGSYPASGTGSRARDLGLRAQKKLLGRVVSTGAGRSLLIDDATTSLLDNLYKLMERAAKINPTLDKKQPEKVLKNIVKLSIKVALLQRNQQLYATDDAKLVEIRNALRAVAMSVVSFYELEFSFDRAYLIKSLERCRAAIQSLIKPHLTDKSQDRCDQMFDFLTHSDFLDSVFRQDSELRPILGMLVSDINKALDAGHL